MPESFYLTEDVVALISRSTFESRNGGGGSSVIDYRTGNRIPSPAASLGVQILLELSTVLFCSLSDFSTFDR